MHVPSLAPCLAHDKHWGVSALSTVCFVSRLAVTWCPWSPYFPDATAVWERVQQQAVRSRTQQVPRVCLWRHLGHRQDAPEGYGDAARQQPAPADPGLQLHRPHAGQDHPQCHERDQLLRGHGQSQAPWALLSLAPLGDTQGKRHCVTGPLIYASFLACWNNFLWALWLQGCWNGHGQ